MTVKTVGVDAPRVTRDRAVELMIHHLELAAMYFEATPEDEAVVRGECERLMARRKVGTLTAPVVFGMRVWLAEMNRVYREEIEHHDGDGQSDVVRCDEEDR